MSMNVPEGSQELPLRRLELPLLVRPSCCRGACGRRTCSAAWRFCSRFACRWLHCAAAAATPAACRLLRLRRLMLPRSNRCLLQARARSASATSLDTLDSEPAGARCWSAAAAAAAVYTSWPQAAFAAGPLPMRVLTPSAGAASADAPPAAGAAGGEPPLSLDEEGRLLKYYGSRLQHVCRELRLPRRVLGTALTYLKASRRRGWPGDEGVVQQHGGRAADVAGDAGAWPRASDAAAAVSRRPPPPASSPTPPARPACPPRPQRIYLAHSCLEQDPQQLLLTCLYLACKVGGCWCTCGSSRALPLLQLLFVPDVTLSVPHAWPLYYRPSPSNHQPTPLAD